MGIPVKLPVFEGPLDLLLHLIDKNKIDIYNIPIVEITDQYLDYISAMEEEDLDVMSEFLVMASTLLDIKSKMLLPAEKDENGEEEDPRQELVDQLLQYKMYKQMSLELRDRQVDADRVLYKKPTVPEEVLSYEQPVDMDALCKDLTLSCLCETFQDVMKKQEEMTDPVRGQFGKIEMEKLTLEEKLREVRATVVEHHSVDFRELLTNQQSRDQIVVTFLAILELMKEGEITVVQEQPFSDIRITAKAADGGQGS